MTAPPSPPSRMWLKGALVLLATFVVGTAAGAAGDHLVHRRQREALRSRGPFQEFRQLGLSPAQCVAIDSVFQQARPRMAAAFQELEPRMRSLTDSIRAEVRAVLTPDQRSRFDSLPGRRDFAGRGMAGSAGRREGPGGRLRPPGPCG